MRATGRLFLLPLLLAASPALAGPDAAAIAAGGQDLRYPAARRLDLVEDHFGVKVADPYRWLENDVRADSAVRDWVDAENGLTRRYIDGLPGREAFKARMQALFAHGRYTVPRKAGGRYFYGYNKGLQNQTPLYVRDGLNGAQRLLIDPNDWAGDGASALAEWTPSPDGRYLAYAVQEAGSDWRTLRVLDVDSGKTLEDRVEWVKFSQTAWDGRGEGFFYSRFAAPAPGEAFRSSSEGQQLFYHRIGSPQEADILVYATPDRPALSHQAQVTSDGQWLLINSFQGIDPRREIQIAPLDGAPVRPRLLVRGPAQDWRLIGSRGATLYFITDDHAPHQRIVTLDATRPRRGPKEVVRERGDTLAGGSLVGNRMILAYMTQAETVAELVELGAVELAPALLSKKIDIAMAGLSAEMTQKQGLAATAPYMASGQIILVRLDNYKRFGAGTAPLKDSKVRIGVVAGSMGERFVNSLKPKGVVNRYAHPPQGVQALIDSHIDVFIHDLPANLYYASVYVDQGLTPGKSLMTGEELVWAVRPDNAVMLKTANDYLAGLRKSGGLQQLLDRTIPFYRNTAYSPRK